MSNRKHRDSNSLKRERGDLGEGNDDFHNKADASLEQIEARIAEKEKANRALKKQQRRESPSKVSISID